MPFFNQNAARLSELFIIINIYKSENSFAAINFALITLEKFNVENQLENEQNDFVEIAQHPTQHQTDFADTEKRFALINHRNEIVRLVDSGVLPVYREGLRFGRTSRIQMHCVPSFVEAHGTHPYIDDIATSRIHVRLS